MDSIGGVLAVAVRGALVAEATRRLRDCLQQAIRGARPVVLDLTEVEAIDAEAIELLMETNRGLATRFRVVVSRGDTVHEALRRAGTAHVLSLHTSGAEALAAAAPPG